MGFALIGTPGISSSVRQDRETEAFRQRPASLILVDRHDDQRFAHPLDKRVQKNWRGTQSDPFLPAEIYVLHPTDGFSIKSEQRTSLILSGPLTGFLARAPPLSNA